MLGQGVEAGSTYVRLGGEVEEKGFKDYDAAIERARRQKAVETKLGGELDPTAFVAYDKALKNAQQQASRKSAFRAALGAEYNPQAFRAYEKALKDAERETERSLRQQRAEFDNLNRGVAETGAGVAQAGTRLAAFSTVAVGAAGAVAGVAAQLAPLAGLLGAVPGLFGAGAQAGGVFALATKDVGAALDGNKEALKRLTPEAQQFVKTLKSYDPEVKRLQRTAQRGLFPGLEEGLEGAARNLPVVERLVGRTAKAMGGLARDAGESLGSKEWGRDLEIIGDQNVETIDRFGRAGGNLADALRHVTVAAEPLVDYLGEGAEDLSEWASNAAEAGRKSGDLRGFFKDTVDVLERVAGIGEDAAVSIANIADAAAPLGDEVLDQFERGAEALRKFTENPESRRELEEFFRDVEPLVEDAGDALGGIASVIGRVAAKTADFLDDHPKLRQVVTTLAMVGVAAKVTGVATGLGKVTGGLKKVYDAAKWMKGTKLGSALSDNIVDGLKGTPGKARGAMNRIRSWLSNRFTSAGSNAGGDAASEAASTLGSRFRNRLGRVRDRIRSALSSVFSRGAESAGTAAGGDAASTVASGFRTRLDRLRNRVRGVLRSVFKSGAESAAGTAGSTAAEGITHNTAVGMRNRNERLKGFFKRFGKGLGIMLAIGLIIGFKDEFEKLGDEIKKPLDKLRNSLNSNPNVSKEDRDRINEIYNRDKEGKQFGGPIGRRGAYGGGDRRLILAEDGEFMVRKEAVRRLGMPFMRALNEGRIPGFQAGGSTPVRGTAAPAAAEIPTVPIAANLEGERDRVKKPLGEIADEFNKLADEGEKAGKKTAKGLGRNLDEGRKDTRRRAQLLRRGVTGEVDAMGDDSERRAKRLRTKVTGEFQDLRTDASRETLRLASTSERHFDDVTRTGTSKSRLLARRVVDRIGDMRRDSGREMRSMSRTADARFEDMVRSGRRRGGQLVRSVGSSMGSTDRAVFVGLNYVADATREALKAFDADPIKLNVPRPRGIPGRAVGGMASPYGGSAADDHLLFDPQGRPVAALSGSEGVVNRPQMGVINTALGFAKSMLGLPWGSLGELWGSGMRHYQTGGQLKKFAVGGMVSGDTDFVPALGAALNRMARATSQRIYVQSGRRTIGEQAALYASMPAGMAAAPTPNAPHVRGIAADITPGRERFGAVASRFGLSFPIGNEPWHVQIGRIAAGAAGAFADAAAAIPKIRVRGTVGPMRALVQRAVNKLRRAGEDHLDTATSSMVGVGDSGQTGAGGGGTPAQNMRLGRQMLGDAAQWPSLRALWERESGWNQFADNPDSDAYGIPQALPGSKMASKGSDWRTNPRTQIAWGLDYIKGRYGTPAAADAFQRANNWYGLGGLLRRFNAGGPLGTGATRQPTTSGIFTGSLDPTKPGGLGASGRRAQSRRGGLFNRLATEIGRLETRYGQKEREFNLTDETWVREPETDAEIAEARRNPGAFIDKGQLRQHVGELEALRAIQIEIRDKRARQVRAAGAIIATYQAAKRRVNQALSRARAALKGARGKRKKSWQRRVDQYEGNLKTIGGRLSEWGGRHTEASDQRTDASLDVQEATKEIKALDPTAVASEILGGLSAPSASTDPSSPADDPDLAAQLARANERIRILGEENRTNTAIFRSTFGGPGDIGTGQSSNAYQAAYADGLLPVGAGVGFQQPGGFAGAVAAAAPAEGMYLVRVDSPEGQRQVARFSNGGNNMLGGATSPRVVTGA